MIKAAILGGSGYTALELIKILLRDPQAEIAAVTSRQDDSPHIADLHPSLARRLDLRCDPQTGILGLAPLAAGGYLAPRGGVVIDSKSGVSGGGRTPKLSFHFPECNESVSAYAIGSHRHTPEMEQVLSDVAGGPVE